MASITVRLTPRLAEVDSARWNALLGPEDNPFVDWRFLCALEEAGCVSADAGWVPLHLCAYRGRDLVAAAPAYIKGDSEGDFGRDWDLAAAAERAGLPYYPKLVIGVPFTPVTGRRLLIRPGEDEAAASEAIVGAALQLIAGKAGEPLGGLHVLFPTADEATRLAELGLIRRVGIQYHFRNPGYRSTDEFYARFTSKRRHALRREMAAPARQGITLRTVRGDEIAKAPERYADLVHTLHRATVDKLLWGRRWLNQAFYRRLLATMPAPLEVVVAEREGRVIAGAFNVRKLDGEPRLFGRYWGCLPEAEGTEFLHFNVCYYHSIAECITHGVRVFEGGAGGEHKIARGFEPAETYSALRFRHAGLDQAVRRHVLAEASQREAALARWREESPLLKPFSPRGQEFDKDSDKS
ncbi:MAG: GNAT family N-acetyltransferase [Polyangia bacterium]